MHNSIDDQKAAVPAAVWDMENESLNSMRSMDIPEIAYDLDANAWKECRSLKEEIHVRIL